MSKVFFDKEGTEAEFLCAKQFNGRLTKQLEHQYKDIDLFIKSKQGDWKSCSVKDQLRGTRRGFTSVQIELELVDTDTQESIKGCFYTNNSEYYFWRVWWNNAPHWCVIPTEELKAFVEKNKASMREWSTTERTEQKNKEYGRKYNRAKGVELELEDMASLGSFLPVKQKGELH